MHTSDASAASSTAAIVKFPCVTLLIELEYPQGGVFGHISEAKAFLWKIEVHIFKEHFNEKKIQKIINCQKCETSGCSQSLCYSISRVVGWASAEKSFPAPLDRILICFRPDRPDLFYTVHISVHIGGREKSCKDEIIVWHPSSKQCLKNFCETPLDTIFFAAMCHQPAWLQLYAQVQNLPSIN